MKKMILSILFVTCTPIFAGIWNELGPKNDEEKQTAGQVKKIFKHYGKARDLEEEIYLQLVGNKLHMIVQSYSPNGKLVNGPVQASVAKEEQ